MGEEPLLILSPFLGFGDPREGKGYVAIAYFWAPETARVGYHSSLPTPTDLLTFWCY